MNAINKIYFDDNEDTIRVIDINNIQACLAFDETGNEEISVFDMASLGTFLLVEHAQSTSNNGNEDDKLQRLSLAYERLHCIPKILVEELSSKIKILDITFNEFDNLDFLTEFKHLTTLICDHNNITSTTTFPYLPKLELLWMNHCKISSLYPWAKKLQIACPKLKYLSLMGNPVARSYLNGGSFYEYLQYRLFIISLFPNLLHLDDNFVTEEQKIEAKRMYHRPLVERLVTKANLDFSSYLRSVSATVSNILTPRPNFVVVERNVII